MYIYFSGMETKFVKVFLKKQRKGRGLYRGGTSGRGHKGYKARSGSVVKGFEGGQTPIYRRLPMRGFHNKPNSDVFVITISKLSNYLKGVDRVDNDFFVNIGLIRDNKKNVKIIWSNGFNGEQVSLLKKISVYKMSKSVEEFFKKNGVECVINSK